MDRMYKILLVIALTGLFVITINMWHIHSVWLGVPGFMLYTVALGTYTGGVLLTHISRLYQTVLGSLVLWCVHIILSTTLYYVHGTTILTVSIVLCAPLFVFLVRRKTSEGKIETNSNPWFSWIVLTTTMIDIVLLVVLYTHQTTGLMVSPWEAVSPWFFILYALATGLLLWFLSQKKINPISSYAITTLHFFLTLGVAAIIYKLGFGFDAFIHRATEEWIAHHGFILPKNPYYIGQYSFVVFLHLITNIPIFYIDVYLVPVLASIGIPLATAYMMNHAWNISLPKALLGSFIWLFVPFWSLHLTTPHNLVLLLTILIITTSVPAILQKSTFWLPFIISLAALMTHPLVGAPVFVFVCVSWIVSHITKRYVRNTALVLYTVGLSLLLPILFSIKNILARAPLPTFNNPLSSFSHFLELFARPYWYAEGGSMILQIVYAWEICIPLLICALAIYGYTQLATEERKHLAIYLYTPAGLFLSAWFLRSWITFTDVVIYEQGDYPLRLLKTSLLFLTPLSIYGIIQTIKNAYVYWLAKCTARVQHMYLIVFVSIIAFVLTTSWYLSYPQLNQKVRFPGKNITSWDMEAVEWIHKDNTNLNYVVLANQLVSAAALTKYSFAQYFETPHGELFYYAIPTGGLLYEDYGRMIYEGQQRSYMEHAMDTAGVHKAYFVLNSYWANAPEIVEGAKKTADSWQVIGDNKIFIFTYTR